MLWDGLISQGQEGLYTGKEVGFTDIIYMGDLTEEEFKAGKAKGKILFSFHYPKDIEAFTKSIGVVGVIIATRPYDYIEPGTMDIPCAYVDFEIGMDVMLYLQTTKYVSPPFTCK